MSETVPIQVTAYGTLAAGAGPHYKLVVDGTVVGDATVGTQSQSNSFSTTLASGQPHDIQIVYDNDTVVGNDDRNLYLQSITVNGQTIPATDPTEVYHATSGPGDIPSNGNMYWGGTAEFSLPASDFPAASVPTTTSGPAFYVSPTGNDRNDGSASHPFATLGAAQAAMEGSSIKLAYVEGGTYTLSSPLVLGQADSGMTFKAAPGQTATLNGQNVSNLIDISGASGVTLSGLSFENTGDAAVLLNNGASGNNVVGNDFESNGTAVRVISSNSNTISGNQIDNSGHAGIEVQDGASKNTLDSNLINGVSATGTTGGGIFLHGTSSNTISHNQVENTAGFGIGVLNWDGSTVNTGDIVTGNKLLNTGTGTSYDTGPIYVLGRSDIDTGIVISNNYIDGTGPTSAHIVGIYLDDYTSGVTVDNNILRNIGTHGLEIHGGHDNNVYNNVFDLGTITKSAGLFQAEAGDPGSAGAQNNSFHQNIITSSQASQYNYDSIDGATANIYGNLYYDPAGSFVGGLNASLVQDSNPSYGNPAFQNAAGGNYALGSGSAAGSISFQQINQGSIGLQPTTAHWYA